MFRASHGFLIDRSFRFVLLQDNEYGRCSQAASKYRTRRTVSYRISAVYLKNILEPRVEDLNDG